MAECGRTGHAARARLHRLNLPPGTQVFRQLTVRQNLSLPSPGKRGTRWPQRRERPGNQLID